MKTIPVITLGAAKVWNNPTCNCCIGSDDVKALEIGRRDDDGKYGSSSMIMICAPCRACLRAVLNAE